MRFVLFFLACASVVGLGCIHGPCAVDCITNDMFITSNVSNLVSAQDSCGQTATCLQSPSCSALSLPPPPQGGSCTVTIDLASGEQITTNADWGAPHSTDCCGTQFENTPQLQLSGDAGVE